MASERLIVRIWGRHAGTLERTNPKAAATFTFAQDYAADDNRPALSLSFKDSQGGLISKALTPPNAPEALPPYFAGLLPDGHFRQALATQANIAPEDGFALLAILGRSLPGGVEISPENDSNDGYKNLDEKLCATEPLAAPFRFSLPGSLTKLPANITATGAPALSKDGLGGAWFFRLSPPSWPNMAGAEWAMIQLAKRCGVDVPEARLVSATDVAGLQNALQKLEGPDSRKEPIATGAAAQSECHLLAFRRHDRTIEANDTEDGTIPTFARIHAENLVQAFGAYSTHKRARASISALAQLIWTEIGEDGIAQLVRRTAFSIFGGCADMHLGNWGLLYTDGRTPMLAPAYGLAPTVCNNPDAKLALNLSGDRCFQNISWAHFEKIAAEARLPRKLVLREAKRTIELFLQHWHNSEVRDEIRPALGLNAETALSAHIAGLQLAPC